MSGDAPVLLPSAMSGESALAAATRIAREAGQILLDHFHNEKQVTFKGRGNVVTNVDLLSEELILARLKREFPRCGIIAEESEAQKSDSGYVWIVDPLDGSRNYASELPTFCLTLALARGEEVLVGITYDPIRNELFSSQKGHGSYRNGKPIAVSKRARVKESLVGMDMGYLDDRARLALELVTALWPGMQSLRIMGSSALGLAYAAAGRIDIYFHHNLAPWDMASGILLVKEAGGAITDKAGNSVSPYSGTVIASNAAIHADFLALTEGMAWRTV